MEFQEIVNANLAIAAAFAVLSAAIRGFTGFGSNLIWGPVLLYLYGPVEMVAIMAMTGAMAILQIAVPAARIANWRDIRVILIAAILIAPLGIYSLIHLDPEIVRRAIGGFILIIALILASGWNFKGARGYTAQIVTGGVAGWLAGFAGIGGPICVLYFMAGPGKAEIQRANNTISVGVLSPPVVIMLAINGNVALETVVIAVLLLPPYFLGQWIGARLFYVLPRTLFRRLVLGLLMVIGVTVLAV
jgi:hypothetical protein